MRLTGRLDFYLLSVDEPLEPGGRVRLGRGAVEDEAVADPVVAQPAADHGASVQRLCKMIIEISSLHLVF